MAKLVGVVRITPYVIPMPILPQQASTTCIRSAYTMSEKDSFVPEGLAVWGVTQKSSVQCIVGGDFVFPSSVPALMFASALSFEELETLPLRLLPEKAHQWREKLREANLWRDIPGLFPVFRPLNEVELYFEGPVTAAVFWGKLRQPQ